MNMIDETVEIDGVAFQFIGEPQESGLSVRCVPQDQRYLPLCGVVETAWRYSPVRLLNSARERHGQSFEGEISFGYYEDYPDELEPGVTVDYLGEELVVSEEMFRRFVVKFAMFHLRATRELLPGRGTDAALLPLLAPLQSNDEEDKEPSSR